MDFISEHWQWFLLGLYVLEKIVKATPTKKDDIIFDMIIRPIIGKVKNAKIQHK